ncbi:TolC family protein [Cognatishimia sp. F0-27]|uniref:TolC family protein n=1 Tax=Cognatishimia sp. F0-27 TaxID=2816855 RepID=UPI001D0C86B8|nr:TolC family protein [Cognatishimia sp. F0-27]MCC1492003.1 TolC family protein [Cognatishimia sp. F0-27]
MKAGRTAWGVVAILALLPGCMKTSGLTESAARFLDGGNPADAAAQETASPDTAVDPVVARASGGAPVNDHNLRNAGDVSPVIAALQHRDSAIAPGTPYAKVADAVMASDTRVAAAELRVAQLRAEAAKRNWLPRIGPRISLNSLGDFVTDLFIQQVLFDNGRKKAERDLAKANVELAAVALVEDGNKRVYEALDLYLTAQQQTALARHLSGAGAEMAQFEHVMRRRVEGGVSDMSDLNILRQKTASIRARMTEAQEAAQTAMAELNAMAGWSLNDVSGLGGLSGPTGARALGVLRAEVERDIHLAEARIARASHLPGLTATASTDGTSGLEVTTDQLFGFGTGAALSALEAGKEAAERKIGEAAERAARQRASAERQQTAFQRQAKEASVLRKQAKANLDLFRRQYEGGQRQVMDVVGTYETYATALETEIELKYKAARAALSLARIEGSLAEGARI